MLTERTAGNILQNLIKHNSVSKKRFGTRIVNFYCNAEHYEMFKMKCDLNGYKKSIIFRELLVDFIGKCEVNPIIRTTC